MTKQFHRVARFAFVTLLFTTTADLAFAQDANAVAERMKEVFARQGTMLSWTGIREDGNTIVLEGVTAGAAGVPDSFPIGEVTLSDVTEDGGDYSVGTVKVGDINSEAEGNTFSVTGISLTGLSLPAEGSDDPVASMLYYDSAEIGSVSVITNGTQVFAMNNFSAEITPPEDGKPMEFSGAAEKFHVDLSTVADPQSKAVLSALGYEKIDGYLEMAGTWQPTDGMMSLSQYDITIDKAGTLGMTFDLGGMTPAFLKSLQDMQKQMAAQPAGADNSAQGLAMLGLMQQLTFNRASIRFDDDTLTTKALDYVAQQQRQKPADIANQAKAIVPIMLAQLGNAELSMAAGQAVTKYLDDPKSLEIVAQPPQPVPFAQIMAGAMAAPQELTKTLAVTVRANED